MIYFVGAGSGAPDLITVRGRCDRLRRFVGQSGAFGLQKGRMRGV